MTVRRLALAVVVLAALAFAGAWLGSPWLAARDLMRAARERDAAALQARIDMPAVRASLKQQLGDKLEQSLERRAAKNEPLAALGLLVGPALVDKAVDATVTPETLAQIVRTARAPKLHKSAQPSTEDKTEPVRVKAELGMTGLNRFDIRLYREDEPDRRLTLVMRRRGLFDWKLTDVELPS